MSRTTILSTPWAKCLVALTLPSAWWAAPVDRTVRASDTQLVPVNLTTPIVAPISSYNWYSSIRYFHDGFHEPTIYDTDLQDRDNDEYWDVMVDELLLERVPAVLMHGRGCISDDPNDVTGAGRMCPRLLTKLNDALRRAGATWLKVGMFIDTAQMRYNYHKRIGHEPSGDPLDMSDEDTYRVWWELNVKIFFDIIPREQWFLMDGRPVVYFWHYASKFFSNREGNGSKLLAYLKAQFREHFGVEPFFVLQDAWWHEDSTISSAVADAKHGWFDAKKNVPFTYESWNGYTTGLLVTSYRDSGNPPGCGQSCREILRRDGWTLEEGLVAGAGSDLIVLEAHMNMVESCGYYRSPEWRYPTQYINIVRRYAERDGPKTLRFQAEGCDVFFDTTAENLGGEYSSMRAIDVGRIQDGNGGFYVGWTKKGEWLQYSDVQLACGTYRFTARIATRNDTRRMRLALPGLSTVALPHTGGIQVFDLVHLGEVALAEGRHDLRLVFETDGDLHVDWIFLKRESVC